jgi:hypothetical protein
MTGREEKGVLTSAVVDVRPGTDDHGAGNVARDEAPSDDGPERPGRHTVTLALCSHLGLELVVRVRPHRTVTHVGDGDGVGVANASTRLEHELHDGRALIGAHRPHVDELVDRLMGRIHGVLLDLAPDREDGHQGASVGDHGDPPVRQEDHRPPDDRRHEDRRTVVGERGHHGRDAVLGHELDQADIARDSRIGLLVGDHVRHDHERATHFAIAQFLISELTRRSRANPRETLEVNVEIRPVAETRRDLVQHLGGAAQVHDGAATVGLDHGSDARPVVRLHHVARIVSGRRTSSSSNRPHVLLDSSFMVWPLSLLVISFTPLSAYGDKSEYI